VASPCSADWDEMVGDGPVRFCGKCEKNVYNLSEMSRADGEALIAAQETTLCVRLYRRADGTVMTADCPVGVERLRFRARLWARVSGAVASLGLLLGLAGGRARADLAVATNGTQIKTAPVATKAKPPTHVAMGGAPAPHKTMGKMIARPLPEDGTEMGKMVSVRPPEEKK